MKIAKMLGASVLLIASLVGCGNSNMTTNSADIDEVTSTTDNMETEEVISLKLWMAKEDQEMVEQLIESFKEEHSEEAEFEIIIEHQEEAFCKDAILNNVNEAPDLFTFADDQIMGLAAAGVLEPITYQEEILANNLEGSVQAASLNGEIYAYPLTADNGYFMYYNKDYFTEEDVKSLDRMLEVAEANDKQIKIDFSTGWYLYSFFGNTGLTLGINEDYVTNYCTWNSTTGDIKGTDVVEAMSQIAASKGLANVGDEGFISGAQDGKIIAGISGAWSGVALEEAWKDGYAATKLPTYTVAGKQVQMSSYIGYKMIGVNSYSKNREWAEKLAKYLSNEESQKVRFNVRGQIPSNINATNSEEIQQAVIAKALLEQSEFATVQRIGQLYWEASRQFGNAIASGDFGGLTSQGLLDRTVEQITSSIVSD